MNLFNQPTKKTPNAFPIPTISKKTEPTQTKVGRVFQGPLPKPSLPRRAGRIPQGDEPAPKSGRLGFGRGPWKTLGFTLVEVMIAMVIMGGLTVLVSQTIRTSVQNKRKLSNRMYTQAMLYDTLRIMKMDIEKAFNYKDVFYQIERQAIQQMQAAQSKSSQKRDQQLAVLPKQPKKLTHFLGESDTLHFTSLNHFRTNYNAQESNQMEVGYFVEGCVSRKTKESTKCLWRRYQATIDDEVDEGGQKSVIAEYVTHFKLTYRGDDFSTDREPEWVDQWRSDNKGRPDHRDKFPHQVLIELELHNDSKKSGGAKVKETIVVNVHFPNNEPFFDNPSGGGKPGQPKAN